MWTADLGFSNAIALLEKVPEAMPKLSPAGVNAALVPLAVEAEAALAREFPGATPHELDVLRAGVWLLADDLDRAHELCQDVPTTLGSAWHAVMHRREGDFSNSLYWWNRARGLAWALPGGVEGDVAALFQSYDPAVLVRQAEKYADAVDAVAIARLLEVQRLEWISLFTQSVRVARKSS